MGLVRKTNELGEYEDSEFNELSKALEVLFEVFKITANEFIHVTGARGKEIAKTISKDLAPDYQKFFKNVSLDQPDQLGIKEKTQLLWGVGDVGSNGAKSVLRQGKIIVFEITF